MSRVSADIQDAIIVSPRKSVQTNRQSVGTRRQSTARRNQNQHKKKNGFGDVVSSILTLVSCAVLIFVAVFAISQTLANQGQENVNGGPLGQVALGAETRAGNAYIGLFIIEDLSPAAQTAFDDAAARWSAIVGGNLPNINGATFPVGSTFCQGGFLVNETEIVVDHLMIAARVAPIDGSSGTLGFAGPCVLDSGSKFPIFGQMVFDSADVADLVDDGVLNDVILHEMGHVLGIGTLWSQSIQGTIRPNFFLNSQILLQDPVLGTNNQGQTVVVQTTEQPKFIGTNARAQFDATFAVSGSDFVPVEDGTLNGQELFSGGRQNGAGSIDGHWDIEPMGNELLTFRINPQVNNHPLSRITLASLIDLGYVVDLNEADNFALNKEGERNSKNLRGKTYYLMNDSGLFLD